MSTITINASGVGWNYYNSSLGSWYRDYAFQGMYKNEAKRLGVIMFSTLRNNIQWRNMEVSSVSLRLTFGNAGSAIRKTLGLYRSTKNAISGFVDDMKGDSIGQVYTPYDAYSRNTTVVFNNTTNAAAFANIKNWIELGSTCGIVFFMNEEASSTSRNYSTNFTNISGGSITIEYEVKGSSGVLNKSSADIGDDIKITITPIASEYPVTHTLLYECGSSSYTATLNAGVTEYTFTVPYSWLSELANTTSTIATCTLTTYEDNVEKGAYSYDFNVNVPSSYTPAINSFSVKRYSEGVDEHGDPTYYPSMSGNKVWVSLDCLIDRDEAGGVARNPGTASIRYYADGDETNAVTINIPWNSDSLTLVNDRTIITSIISLSTGWVFELTASNGHESIVSTVRVEKAWAPFHVAGTGYGIGIGMYSTGTQADPRLESAWPVHLIGGVRDFGGSIQYGTTVAISTPSGTYRDQAVVFDTEFDSAPIVVANFSNDSNSGAFGNCCCAVLYGSVTTTGFTVRVHNGDSSTRAPWVTWIAIGQVTPST